jgi:hypothetical protein
VFDLTIDHGSFLKTTVMNNELERRINEKDQWTFRECLGLASEFQTKTRFVVAMVLAQGKNYLDGDDSSTKTKK